MTGSKNSWKGGIIERMKKKILSLLLAAVMLLAVLPGMAAAAPGAKPASGDLFTENLTTDMAGVKFDTSFNMVFVEGGTFTLGWEASDASLRPENVDPVRNVTVSDFYIGETEVTVSMWNAVMGLAQPGFDANRPKEQVSFYQVQEFLDRLYVLTGRTYRLATEAEWEFAAKGGNPGKVGNADYPGNNHKYLFAGSNVHDEVVASRASVQNVKTKKPNILGIYDLCGNAEEWVYNSFDAALVGGVDPIGPGGPLHQQKTRRGGTYGGTSPDSTRTLSARQIRSIDGGAGMGFRIALSGDMNSVPPGMIRPRDVVHPNIDERELPVTYRDQRLVSGDGSVWYGNFYNAIFVTMKLWDTGEMVIQSPGFDDRVGQWYTVSNLGIVFVQNAFEENETRITLPYMFMTDELISVINDVSFMGDGLPMCRFEKQADAAGIRKPEGLTLYDPAQLAAASTHDHTSYDLSSITEEMKGHDPRLLDGEGFGWWLSASVGMHQYRQDITDETFRFVVYSPAFNFGRNGADVGYGANFLAQGSWYTVNDMLLVIGEGANVQHYLYTVTDEVSSYILPNKQVKQLMEISYQSYEKGDMRYLERHANADVRGYSGEIPNGFVLSQGGSTFLAPPAEEETLCPGGCGQVISHCRCATICPNCNEHIDNCWCSDASQRLAKGASDAAAALSAYVPSNSVTADHLDAVARLGIGYHNISRSWSGFSKVNATREQAGSVSAVLTLAIAGETKTVPVSLTIPALPKASSEGWSVTPDATIGGETVTMIATDLDGSFTRFDIMSLFGASGGPYTYAMWFGPDGTFSFDHDVTLTKTYYAADFSSLGTDSIPVKAGQTIRVADGVYSEVSGETVAWSEFLLTLDDGSSWMIIDSAAPGNYAAFPPDVPLSEFPGKAATPPAPPAPQIVAYTVMLTKQALKVNGVEQSFEIYNIDGSNYFKLRDLAYILNGTGSQFSVGYDNATHTITCTRGEAYTPVGGEAQPGEDKSSTATPSSHSLYIDGAAVSLQAFNIGGNNFFKLRDLGEALNFKVDYDGATKTMLVDSVG